MTTSKPYNANFRFISLCSATEGAEAELGLHNPIAKSAPQHLRDRRRVHSGLRRWERVGLRKEEVAIVAVHDRLFPWPTPHGDEEELQNLLVLHQIRRRPARYAPARAGFQHLPHLLLDSSGEEEEHFSPKFPKISLNSFSLYGFGVFRSWILYWSAASIKLFLEGSLEFWRKIFRRGICFN